MMRTEHMRSNEKAYSLIYEKLTDAGIIYLQASKHLFSLINEVLDMSKIESGKVQLIEEEFNLSDLVDHLLSMISSQIEEHHHEISVNISGVIHEAVIGDSLRIQKVFTNLMGNAVKFTPDGGKIRLSISDVLVADDDALSLESCVGMLCDLGMKAEGVLNGSEAVKRVISHHEQKKDYFTCIIDWKMPDMDGVETTRAILKAVGPNIPIIIISAYDWSDIEQEARMAGENAFISKPLFRSRLERTFGSILNEDETDIGITPFDSLESLDYSNYRALLVEDNELNAEIAEDGIITCRHDGVVLNKETGNG